MCVCVPLALCLSLSMRSSVCACVHATWCTCAKQMTPMPVWVFPRCGWCMDHVVWSARGHIGSIVLGSSLNVALNLHWVKERFTSSAQPSTHLRHRGRSVLDQPPAGRIRCYLSDWGHHHQSFLSSLLSPESNHHSDVHLRWQHADKISNSVCKNVAMLFECVEGEVRMY